MLAPDFVAGAGGRLLPASVPFRFFGAALVFHIIAWLLILVAAGDLPGFMGGPGPVLAALHLVTLGVAAMTAIGASFQLLPVATKRPPRSVGACNLTFWLFLPGMTLLTMGMSLSQTTLMTVGGGIAAAGLAIYAWLVVDNLRRVGDMRLVTDHTWIAAASLVALATLGLFLIADFRLGFLADHRAVARAHLVMAGYGFMGMLAVGFTFILVPMFAMAPSPNVAQGRRSAWLAVLALPLAVAGLVYGIRPLVFAAGATGLAACGAHLMAVAKVMKTRMKKRLGDSFILIRAAWVLMPVSIVIGLLAAADVAVDKTGPLFGFVLVFGWLLSFITGILQRVMPFLASMHSVREGVRPVLVSRLIADRPLRIHLICHFAALALLAGGIVTGLTPVVRLGAGIGLVGAVSFAVFAALLWQRLNQHLNSSPK